MAAPKYDIIQTDYKNPDASSPLKLSVIVVPNTPEEVLIDNVKQNSAKYENWLCLKEEHKTPAVFIGGGASINDCLDEITYLYEHGATIIAMNGSAKWCRQNDIIPDWQVIVDAQKDTSLLVDPECKSFFASQVHPDTTGRAKNLTLVQFGLERVEQHLPEERVKAGGYTLLAGGSSVGLAALGVAYSQGYREMHLFGYDSSYKDDQSHGYFQALNRFMPTVDLEWMGKTYKVSVAMKAQAERFPRQEYALRHAGCDVHVYGEGYLQAIFNARPQDMSEKEKYQLMWNIPDYRLVSPGELQVDTFVNIVDPKGLIVDFGCGTGRASVKLAEKGFDVLLVDFTDNCRDEEAIGFPFVQADLTKPMRFHGDYGFCADVMEHIPTSDVVDTIRNIMKVTPKTFFQISTIYDSWGEEIDNQLHLTVKPHDWWKRKFISLGYEVKWEFCAEIGSIFYIQTGAENDK